MGRKLLKNVQTITSFRNPFADPMGTRRGPQFENRCYTAHSTAAKLYTKTANTSAQTMKRTQ